MPLIAAIWKRGLAAGSAGLVGGLVVAYSKDLIINGAAFCQRDDYHIDEIVGLLP
jgi:hypothetical protein